MVGTCGITRCRTDALVLFSDQLLIRELFCFFIAPVLLSHLFVQTFCKCFNKTIRKDLHHDLVVFIMFGSKAINMLSRSIDGYCKTTHVICACTLAFRTNKISERIAWLSYCL